MVFYLVINSATSVSCKPRSILIVNMSWMDMNFLKPPYTDVFKFGTFLSLALTESTYIFALESSSSP